MTRRESKARELTTNLTWMNAWLRVQIAYPGRDFASLTADEWTSFIAGLRDGAAIQKRMASTTIYTTVNNIKASLARMMGVGYKPKDLPQDILDALDVETPEPDKVGHVIEPALFHRLLTYAVERDMKYATPAHVAMKVALLWAFWDSGFRSDELRCLNVGEVQFQADGGAYLQLPSKVEALRRDCRLKTKKSSRRIYIHECVGPLKAWLAHHPNGTDPNAPLFLGFRLQHAQRITKGVLGGWIRRIGDGADVSTAWGAPDLLGGHDFRHTRITRAARENWHPSKGSMYFWGIPNSKEWATYAHVEAGDLRDQVRRDLGLDPLGYKQAPVPALPANLQAVVQAEVQRILAETLTQRGTRPPQPHELP